MGTSLTNSMNIKLKCKINSDNNGEFEYGNNNAKRILLITPDKETVRIAYGFEAHKSIVMWGWELFKQTYPFIDDDFKEELDEQTKFNKDKNLCGGIVYGANADDDWNMQDPFHYDGNWVTFDHFWDADNPNNFMYYPYLVNKHAFHNAWDKASSLSHGI